MPLGFTVVCGPTSPVFSYETEAEAETDGSTRSGLVSSAFDADGIAAVLGRLRYRRELADRVGLRSEPGSEPDDAALVLACYRAEGARGLERLEGDFAAAVWDTRAAQLVALRDPLGGYPLFWGRAGDRFVLSTSTRPVLDHIGDRGPDLDFLADFLAVPDPRSEPATDRTIHLGVQRVRPGMVFTLDPAAGRVACRAYWNWFDHVREPGSDRLDEIAAEYLAVLKAAVAEALRGPGSVLAHLSGGMDSSSIALLAAELAAEGNGAGPVHGFTMQYDAMPGLTCDRPYIDAVYDRAPGSSRIGCLPMRSTISMATATRRRSRNPTRPRVVRPSIGSRSSGPPGWGPRPC
jgi:asparagine synthase (glutamine-hydrolysing)